MTSSDNNRPGEVERAQAVVQALAQEFGPGFSNGVSAILLNDALPEVFNKSNWADWFFKPADGAFEWALKAGLIEPVETPQWKFTPLGLGVRALTQQEKTDAE